MTVLARRPVPAAVVLSLLSPVVPPLVLMLALPRRVRVWALLACGAFGLAAAPGVRRERRVGPLVRAGHVRRRGMRGLAAVADARPWTNVDARAAPWPSGGRPAVVGEPAAAWRALPPLEVGGAPGFHFPCHFMPPCRLAGHGIAFFVRTHRRNPVLLFLAARLVRAYHKGTSDPQAHPDGPVAGRRAARRRSGEPCDCPGELQTTRLQPQQTPPRMLPGSRIDAKAACA